MQVPTFVQRRVTGGLTRLIGLHSQCGFKLTSRSRHVYLNVLGSFREKLKLKESHNLQNYNPLIYCHVSCLFAIKCYWLCFLFLLEFLTKRDMGAATFLSRINEVCPLFSSKYKAKDFIFCWTTIIFSAHNVFIRPAHAAASVMFNVNRNMCSETSQITSWDLQDITQGILGEI